MFLEDREEVERIIKKIIVKTIKLYKGKGPDYANVKIVNDKIEMCAKGILSPMGKFLIDHDGMEEVENIRQHSQSIMYKYLIDEIYKETNLKCEIIYEEYDFIEDFRKAILKIEI